MNKDNGAVLGMTVTFVLIFTMLGLGSMYFAGSQAIAIQKRVAAREAFWLAEGGIQRGIQYIIDNNPNSVVPYDDPPESLGGGTYKKKITPDPYNTGSEVRWQIDSIGSASNVDSHLEAIVGPNVMDALTTTGTIKPNPEENPDALDVHIEPDGSYKQEYTFFFEEIFGITEAQMQSLANIYENAASNVSIDKVAAVVEGVTWINQDSGSMIYCASGWEGSGILVINGGEFKMEGGSHFSGVIWVEGACLKINGDEAVTGAVFVHDTNEPPGETTVNGSSAIDFSADGGGIDAVDDAFSYIGTSFPGNIHTVVSWNELY